MLWEWGGAWLVGFALAEPLTYLDCKNYIFSTTVSKTQGLQLISTASNACISTYMLYIILCLRNCSSSSNIKGVAPFILY